MLLMKLDLVIKLVTKLPRMLYLLQIHHLHRLHLRHHLHRLHLGYLTFLGENTVSIDPDRGTEEVDIAQVQVHRERTVQLVGMALS